MLDFASCETCGRVIADLTWERHNWDCLCVLCRQMNAIFESVEREKKEKPHDWMEIQSRAFESIRNIYAVLESEQLSLRGWKRRQRAISEDALDASPKNPPVKLTDDPHEAIKEIIRDGRQATPRDNKITGF